MPAVRTTCRRWMWWSDPDVLWHVGSAGFEDGQDPDDHLRVSG